MEGRPGEAGWSDMAGNGIFLRGDNSVGVDFGVCVFSCGVVVLFWVIFVMVLLLFVVFSRVELVVLGVTVLFY